MNGKAVFENQLLLRVSEVRIWERHVGGLQGWWGFCVLRWKWNGNEFLKQDYIVWDERMKTCPDLLAGSHSPSPRDQRCGIVSIKGADFVHCLPSTSLVVLAQQLQKQLEMYTPLSAFPTLPLAIREETSRRGSLRQVTILISPHLTHQTQFLT